MVYSIPIYGQLLAMIRRLNIPVFRRDYVSAYHALTFQRTLPANITLIKLLQ